MIQNRVFKVEPGARYGVAEAAVAEVVFTFVLCYVVLSVAASETTKSTQMFGLAIGSCIVVGGNAIGHVSGGFLNPAVALGAASVSVMRKGTLEYAIYYTAFEFVGAAAAALVFMITHSVDKEKEG